MAWTIWIDDVAKKQLKKLDKQTARLIRDYLKELAELEDVRSRGKGLTGRLKGLWRYRVGDYRIICDIHDKDVFIFVIEVGHRKTIYDS